MARVTSSPPDKHTPHSDISPRPDEWSYESSVFWREIEHLGHDHVASTLKLALHDVVKGAKALSKRISAELPTFTLHDEVHLDNVLYWMEQFITPAGLKQLGPVGSALCILVAYTHDVGMVPTPGWRQRLQDLKSPDSRSLRGWAAEHHADLLNLRDRCLELASAKADDTTLRDEQAQRAEWIDRFIQIDYLRATHADADASGRIAAHLRHLADASVLKQAFGFIASQKEAIRIVSDIAASHNQKADWLARRWERERDGTSYWRIPGTIGDANGLLPALLLRLADICDFDRSRTPPVLFHQLGLEGWRSLGLDGPVAYELPHEQTAAAGRSVREWMKHLAVDRWVWRAKDDELAYVVTDCPHPAVERAIRHFCGEIEKEIAAVREELARVLPSVSADWLRLPKLVTSDITRRDYHYEDITFQLQAHEVTQLLMGTSLYGNPELCIRELLQNALDAVQLRDLRQQLRRKLDAVGEVPPPWLAPADPWKPTERETPIQLTWGKDCDTGREWISVRDAGTGMTLDQIKRYLAALGRSYYKSTEFDAEARFMRKHGLLATPISRFGIGILSCFMIAEWIEVRTCPCGRDRDLRKAWRVKITGPGSLFHFIEDTAADRPGTEVRLFLRRGFLLEHVEHDAQLKRLRHRLDYGWDQDALKDEDDTVQRINPPLVAAAHIIWPRYSISCAPEAEPAVRMTIGDRWHFDSLVLPAHDSVMSWALEKEQIGFVNDLRWVLWDWEDTVGGEATGSRIRVVTPTSGGERSQSGLAAVLACPDRLPDWAIALRNEIALEGCSTGARQRFLCKGMSASIGDASQLAQNVLALASGIGSIVWVDFNGEATPQLTADRSRWVNPSGETGERWRHSIDGVYRRWIDAINRALVAERTHLVPVTLVLRLAPSLTKQLLDCAPRPALWSLPKLLSEVAGMKREIALTTLVDAIRAEANLPYDVIDFDIWHFFSRDPGLRRFEAAELAADFAPIWNREDLISYRGVDRRGPDAAEAVAIEIAGEAHVKRALVAANRLGDAWRQNAAIDMLNEGFQPSLAHSFPPLRLPNADCGLASAWHIAPAVLSFEPQRQDEGAWLSSLGFDLVFPFTVLATPQWREAFGKWETARDWRGLLVLPFLVPSTRVASRVATLIRKPRAVPEGLDADGQKHAEIARHVASCVAQLSILVLLPEPRLWDIPFNEWSKEDLRWGGYSALWDITTGEMRWAVGVMSRDDVRAHGLPIEDLWASDQLTAYRQHSPELFAEESLDDQDD